MNNRISSFFDKLKNNKKIQKIIIICLILLLLGVFLFTLFDENNKVDTIENSVDSFVNSLENRLSDTLSQVDGAGKVSVILTVESGMETVLAMKTTVTENSNGIEKVETPILVNGKTVVLKELYPKITGVLIVAEGANNITVLSKIQQATVSLLDINLNQIEILTMK